ncbi:hypothetical protein LWI28_003774 [Acer negundo]|uniref:Zinc knuckle CX2CX4HX4C domain-containing protein n=1 Tax=Acer negundo TaxID=4023 RepID=A0AAD5JC34_ACENE|nr:hypothetical protein LWI28_003774 [Acer negundo]
MSTVSGVNSSSRVVPLASGGMCSLVGEPIPPQHEGDVSDKATSDGDFGHYARVLVDVDVSLVIPTSVLLERDEFHISFIAVEYENLPTFCSTCSSIGHLPSSCRWNKSSKVPLSSTTKSTQDIVGDSRVFGDDGFQPVRTPVHQDVGGHDSVVVHTSVGSNLISSSTSSAGLVLSSNSSSSSVSAISKVASSSVPPMISQALQISKDSGFDDGVTDSILDYCLGFFGGESGSPYGLYHLSRSSSSPSHTARRQVRVHEVSGNQSSEEAVVSSASNVNVHQSSLRDGSGFSCSSVVDPKVQIQSSGPWSASQAELRLIADSFWASQVEEGELIDAEIAQRALRVEHRLASLESKCLAPSTVSDD